MPLSLSRSVKRNSWKTSNCLTVSAWPAARAAREVVPSSGFGTSIVRFGVVAVGFVWQTEMQGRRWKARTAIAMPARIERRERFTHMEETGWTRNSDNVYDVEAKCKRFREAFTMADASFSRRSFLVGAASIAG